jgi:cell division protein FtsB
MSGSGPSLGQHAEPGPSDFLKAAFKWQYNLIALVGTAAFAALSGSALPLILAAGVELIYLSVIPHNKRFQRLVRSWGYAEEKKSHELKISQMWQQLPPDVRSRYDQLVSVCKAVDANYSSLSSASQMLVGQMHDKLQGMLEAYLRLLYADQQHIDYLRTTNPTAIQREIDQLQQKLASETPKVQEINRQRIEILTKRAEKFEKIRENRQVIEAQCAAIEDGLELIRDQSVTMRDPQQVSGQLEGLLQNVEQTEDTVKQVEDIFETAQNESDTLGPLPSDSTISNSAPGATGRVRN